MSYQHQRLEEEVRRCLNVHRNGYHATNIWLYIRSDRLDRSMSGDWNPKKMQSMKRLTNVLAAMPDVERINKTPYWRFIKTGKLYETKQQLTRVFKCLTTQSWSLLIRLDTIKESLKRFYLDSKKQKNT